MQYLKLSLLLFLFFVFGLATGWSRKDNPMPIKSPDCDFPDGYLLKVPSNNGPELYRLYFYTSNLIEKSALDKVLNDQDYFRHLRMEILCD